MASTVVLADLEPERRSRLGWFGELVDLDELHLRRGRRAKDRAAPHV